MSKMETNKIIFKLNTINYEHTFGHFMLHASCKQKKWYIS